MIEDCLTRSSYLGITLQQRDEVKSVFSNLFNGFKPKTIIEIGTGFGGLTLFLRDQTKDFANIYSFDTLERPSHQLVLDSGAIFSTENIFEEKVTDWMKYEIKPEWQHIFNESPKLVLCDGGNKKAEFNGIAKYLTSGDIIMLHDYSTDQETFERLNVWNWLECQYSDIKSSCEEYKMIPFMGEEFLNVAWGCFIKS